MSAPIHVVAPWLAASNVARVRRCPCGGVELSVERVRLHFTPEELSELSDTLDVAVRRLRAGEDDVDAARTTPPGAVA